MKKIGYIFFAWVYNLCCLICPVRKQKAVLWNGHNHGLNGNLLEIYRYMRERSPDCRFVILAKKDLFFRPEGGGRKPLPGLLKGAAVFFFVLPYHMATAGRVFLNDNFLPMGYMKTSRRDTQFVQLWHGAGAFKRFGLSTEENQEVARMVKKANRGITHLFVTSEHVIPFYQEAFGIEREKIYATGLPVTDLYFDRERMQGRRDKLYGRYPQFAGKKLLLYAPTFRREEWENRQIAEMFHVDLIHKILGEEWLILIKMHPKFPMETFSMETFSMEKILRNEYCYNMTDYNNISDLYVAADLMITDYSSTIVEYVLLDKPVILFAFDLERYDRGFYYDYEENMPGEIAHSQEELYRILEKKDKNGKKRQSFAKFQYDNMTGGSCERILEILEHG